MNPLDNLPCRFVGETLPGKYLCGCKAKFTDIEEYHAHVLEGVARQREVRRALDAKFRMSL